MIEDRGAAAQLEELVMKTRCRHHKSACRMMEEEGRVPPTLANVCMWDRTV